VQEVEEVQRGVDGRRGQLVVLLVAEGVELGDELPVEDADVAVYAECA
jgi:hypothetical protein